MQNWYAIYTRPRWEKKVESELKYKGIDVYLPLQKKLKQWSDRKKKVETPLFPSYVFVNIDYKFRFDVLQTSGVVKFVAFSGEVDTVPDKEIEFIKLICDSEYEIESSYENFEKGQMVTVTSGSLKGLIGEVMDIKSSSKLLIRIDSLKQNITLTINPGFLEAI